MARWVAELQHTGAVGITGVAGLIVGIVVGVCMAVMAIGLCTVSGEGGTVQRPANGKDSSDSDDSSSRSSVRSYKKWLSSKKLLSWTRWGAAADDDLSTYPQDFVLDNQTPLESPVWQRTILMGERCEPLVFSGHIFYDEYGKQVQDFRLKSPRSAFAPPSMLTPS